MPTTQTKTFDGESIKIETYFPKNGNLDILFVHHGSSRSTYSSGSERIADQEGFATFAPIFPESSYDGDAYQRGGIVDDRNRVLPEDQWTTRVEEPMIDWARGQVGGDPDVYLFGFSAGGQFLNRVAAYERPEDVSRFVVGSPSTWVLPSLTEDGPYGFDGLGTDAEERQALKEYLALPMTIYLGSEDDNPNDPDLSTSAAAMRQGSNRLERGINTFEMGQEVAKANSWDFNWELVIADGVGHSGSSMLRAPEMKEALHLVDAPVAGPANGAPYDIVLTGSSVDETAEAGTVVGRLSAKDPDGDNLAFNVAGDSRFAVKGSDLVVAPGADLTGSGDHKVNLTVSASDGKGGMARVNAAVTIKDAIDNALKAGAGNDKLYGGASNDRLYGGEGDDRLEGRNGDDKLYGEEGNDALYGGNGRDHLAGGRGRDRLTGGDDADVFRFGAVSDAGRGAARDQIRDFSRSEGDKIDLASIDADATTRGDQSFDFMGWRSFSGDAGELRYRDGRLYADTDGDRRAEFEISVEDAPRLGSGDFLL